MSFTGRIGSIDSRPGNLQPGVDGEGENSLDQVVSQTISFVQSAATGNVFRVSDNSISFGQDASATVDRAAAVSQSLGLSQAVVVSAGKAVDDNLGLVQTVGLIRTINMNVAQGLGLLETTRAGGAMRVSVAQTINFDQVEDTHAGVVNLLSTDVINFTQKVGRTINVSVSQSISFVQEGKRNNTAVQNMGLTQTISIGKGGDITDDLDLIQTVTHTAQFRRLFAQDIGLAQSVAFFVIRACTERQYSPFVGVGDPSYTPPSTTVPTITKHTFTLTYPFVTPSSTLILRNPEFNDKDRLNFNRINRETRGGTLIVFADPKWPKTQTLAVQIDNLTARQAADFIVFLRASLGKEIGLLDWENRQWRGIITTPDAQVTHVGKNDRSISFEFQGSPA